jgi:Iron/zinc purple acid phosphatase-like protein C
MAPDAAAARLPWPMPTFTGVTLEAFNDTHYGYGRLTASATTLTFQYVTVARPPGVDPRTVTPALVDTFTVTVA